MSSMRYYVYLILMQKDMTFLEDGMSMVDYIITKLLIQNHLVRELKK